MKATMTRNSGSEPQKKRKSVAQILRASHALFAKGAETRMAVKTVLGSGSHLQHEQEECAEA
jgi:hypothetical protein